MCDLLQIINFFALLMHEFIYVVLMCLNKVCITKYFGFIFVYILWKKRLEATAIIILVRMYICRYRSNMFMKLNNID